MALWTPYIQEVPLDLSIQQPIETDRQTSEPPLQPQRLFESFTNQPHYRYMLYPGFCVAPTSTCSLDNNVGSIGHVPIPARTASFASSPPTSPEDLEFDEEYVAFEREQLSAIAGRNGGSLVGNNPRMRRAVYGNNDKANEAYRSHREKNNYAAKQSRDRRKMRQISLSIKVAYLTKKLAELKTAVGVCDECRDLPAV